ncbi:grainyhead-like protein 1 homolog [Diretmus argenteus]
MTEESARKRGVVMLHSDQSYDSQPTVYPDEDEAWRVFLENPLVAASKAMMSVNGDEESAASLSLLYDYYKVPREKRAAGNIKTETQEPSRDARPNKINFLVPYQDSLLTVTPPTKPSLHTVIQGIPPSRDNRGSDYPECIATQPTYPGGMEGALHSFPPGVDPPGPCGSQSGGLGFSQALNHDPYSTRTQALTPDSTYTETYKDPADQFEYVLEAPQSLNLKSPSSPMSYLNKGQFYPITLRDLEASQAPQHHTVRSVVMLVFGEEKLCEEQLKLWRFWQSRQHTARQRCIDIADYKESFNTISNIEDIAYNAVSFTWDSRAEARVFLAVNCLSTDFSPQKGVRGQALNLQIDTYVCGNPGDRLVHRAVSQVKVFCDKGAERKIRDEDKKQNRRRPKSLDASTLTVLVPEDKEPPRYVDITAFKPVSDLNTQPVLFIPETLSSFSHRQVFLSDDDEESSGQNKRLLHHAGPLTDHKRPRRDDAQSKTNPVLLYVRKEMEEVFDALMLRTPTLSGLLEAVFEKYELPSERIGKVYKRCKKGILVNMDDNVIRSYSNEDTFQIHMEDVGGQVLLTLTEI